MVGPDSVSSLTSKVIATDLKLANLLLGLMSHGSSHPCTWCDSSKSSLRFKGNLRTLGSLNDAFWRWYDETDQDKSKAKHFGNVIHCPILRGESSERVIDLLPPPELHLLIGPFNKMFKELEKEWPEAMTWPRTCFVEREAIHGGLFNGNSCKKLLSKIDALRSMCPLQGLKYVEDFEKFRKVVDACYGHDLDPDFRMIIRDFEKSYLSLGISISPKVHTVFHHITDFCDSVHTGLGRYSEQAVEAVHADFKSTWAKYKFHEVNPRYPEQLLKAVSDYNAKHLRIF